jgi:hypothetical protein
MMVPDLKLQHLVLPMMLDRPHTVLADDPLTASPSTVPKRGTKAFTLAKTGLLT